VSAFDVAIVGGGIVGLATARELLRRDPSRRIVVIEKEQRLAAHQTGHNSGVIHSGIYYAPGSAKARLCVAGSREMTAYCDEHGIPYERCGKLIVAIDASELATLSSLEQRGAANGVAGVLRLDARGIAAHEPAARGIAALFVPSAAIVDFRRVAESIAAEIAAAGAVIRLATAVTGIDEHGPSVELATTTGAMSCGSVIVCAGLGGDAIARLLDGSEDLRIVPFRGDYWRLDDAARALVRGLIYPVPDTRFPFLGVHFTKRIDGDVWLGPNAVLAFALEGYRRRDVDLGDLRSALGFPGFRALARRYWRTGLAELARDYSKRLFYDTLRRYVPSLRIEQLRPGPSGIRAQALKRDGTLVDDFWFERRGKVTLVRNAPSPAATASLAIAREIVDAALA